MNTTEFEKTTSKILSAISNPFRIKVLLTIGRGEACVCHLETLLKQRQAFISQHLMALRKAGILDTRREGKFIFYRLADSQTYDLIRIAGKLAGLEDNQIPELENPGVSPKCCCPKCEGVEFDPMTISASIEPQEK
ncbi:MAG: helix-turn-helix transcriptional regulator [Chloroflexi bacterium]|nr:helix-turn-helix transcriptional regulator [Chloroflexota bacterium]